MSLRFPERDTSMAGTLCEPRRSRRDFVVQGRVEVKRGWRHGVGGRLLLVEIALDNVLLNE